MSTLLQGATARSAMPPGLIVPLLAIMLGIQPVTTDFYLPTLPILRESFNAPVSQVQLTLSALLLAFGLSQLIWGPLSDRYGRRPILLCGLAAYTLACLGCALAASMAQLIGWRVVQGAAMGAVVMCARAIVRDLYQPQDGARIMSKGLSGLGLLACFCAPLGGLLAQWFSWRVTLLAVTVFGCLSLALMSICFKESLPQKNLRALQGRQLVATWGSILSHRTFLAYSMLSMATYGGIFTFLACSSFVLMDVLGLSRAHYGLMMSLTCVAYISGTVLCRRLLARFTIAHAAALGSLLNLTGGTLLGLFALADLHNVWTVMLPMAVYMLGHGVQQPCGQTGAVGPFPQSAGAASAMNGFSMMLVAFFIGLWIGPRMNHPIDTMAYSIWLCSVVVAVSAWTVVRKYGEPPAATSLPPNL